MTVTQIAIDDTTRLWGQDLQRRSDKNAILQCHLWLKVQVDDLNLKTVLWKFGQEIAEILAGNTRINRVIGNKEPHHIVHRLHLSREIAIFHSWTPH